MKQYLFGLGSGIVACGICSLLISVFSYLQLVPKKSDALIELKKPETTNSIFAETRRGKTVSGIWECQGPISNEIFFWLDEYVYILEGSVEVEYKGKRFTMQPGDAALFRGGTKAKWVFDGKLKKAWVHHDPGRIVRKISGIFR